MTAKRSALIVATSEYKDSRLTALEGPGHDAEALRTVLENAEIGGFDVQLALNSSVDLLRRTLESFFANRGRDDLLLVHFSGHGLKDDDGQLYLAAADTEIDRLLSTGVDAAWVNRLMSKCRSERIALFLDCCFAGAFTSGMARRAGVDTAGVKEQFNGSGLFVIAASDAMQYSFEGGRQVGDVPEPSPFTKALVDGLQSGEADRDEDGHVSINELFDFLEDRIRETSPSQTPTKSAFNQVGDWVIARSTRVPSIRLLPEHVQKLLKSEDALDRFGALLDLGPLIEGDDPRLADAAMQAVEKLAADDSRRVAAAAQRMLGQEVAKPISTTDEARREATPIEATPLVAEAAVATPATPADTAPAIHPPVPAPAAATMAPPASVAPVESVAHAASVAPPPATPVMPAVVTPPVVAPPPTAAPTAAPGWGHVPSAPKPAAATGPIWGQAPSGSASAGQTVAPLAQGHGQHQQSTGVPWSLGRAAARAAVGSLLWVVFQFFWTLSTTPALLEDPDALTFVTSVFTELAILISILTTIAVVIVEKLVPAMRLPGGSFYRAVGGSRWAAAAVLGVLAGLTIGVVIEVAYFSTAEVIGLDIPVCGALGFLVAEAVVGKWFAGNQERSRAA